MGGSSTAKVIAAGCALLLACGSFAARALTADAAASPPAAEARRFDINGYVVDGNSLLQPVEIETLVYPFLGPQRTLEDVDAARAALEKTYQSRGYQSVVVEVPQQQVRGGIVRLQIIEATVGRLRVDGADYFSPRAIREGLPALAEGRVPNFQQAQLELAALNRQADRQVAPLLKPGRLPGTIDVTLKVDDSRPLHGSAELSNEHSQDTPELRTGGSLRYENLWQLGHTISATYLVAPEDRASSEVFSGSYLAPLQGSDWSLLLYGYDSNSEVSAIGGTNVLGKGYAIGFRGLLNLPQGADYSHSLSLGFDYKHFDEDITVGEDSISTPIEYWPLNLGYNAQWVRERVSADFGLTLNLGLRGLGSESDLFRAKRANASENFAYLKLEGGTTIGIGAGLELAGRYSAQLARNPLISGEQFSAGGTGTVRGYLQSEAIGDDGGVASLELRSPSLAMPFGFKPVRDWRLHLFVDAARLWVADALPEQQARFSLMGAGFGSRLRLFDFFYGDVDYSYALTDGTVTREGDPTLHFSVRSEF